MSLEILYQDEWLVAVNKPAGQMVHPADVPKEEDEVTMKILRDQLGERVEVIHRLDRPTCGVLVFGRDAGAAKVLRRSFEKREVEKVYATVACGVREEGWRCEVALRKTEEAPLLEAVTEFQVLERWGEYCLVEARPRTGRYHQIRRHLVASGAMMVGDYRYSGVEECERMGAALRTGTRMLLQAKRMVFAHPVSGEEVVLEAPEEEVFERARAALGFHESLE